MTTLHMQPPKNRSLEINQILSILLLVLIVSNWIFPIGRLVGSNLHPGGLNGEAQSRQPARMGAVTIELKSASGETILFRAKNGNGLDGNPAQDEMIPHLVLKRNGVLTADVERTLDIVVGGQDLLPLDAVLTFKIETQHTNPDNTSIGEQRIPVWTHEIKAGLNTKRPSSMDKLMVVIPPVIQDRSGAQISTPADYYRLSVEVKSQEMSMTQVLVQDYAFVVENQWIASLPELRELTQGAAPKELVIYYLDMIPYQVSSFSPDQQVPRQSVDNLVKELLPGMLEIVRTQTNRWNFPWHERWTSLRGGVDAERISVALTQAGMWYHGPAPIGANSYISINVNQTELKTYDKVQDWILAIFSHELFHNQQRNLNLQAGGNGDVDGSENAWEFITEGTAVLASSITYARLGYLPFTADGPYIARANEFISGSGSRDGVSHAQFTGISPYAAAIYWRFLYENFGRLPFAEQNPAAGMDVIRNVLNTLYSDPRYFQVKPAELAAMFPELMDQVLGSDHRSPFKGFRGSWAAFAQAVYGLSLDRKDIQRPGTYTFYDPYHRYAAPAVEEVEVGTGSKMMTGSFPGSIGMHFVNIDFDAQHEEQPVTLRFTNLASQPTVFHLQVWTGANQSATDSAPSGVWDLGDVGPGEGQEYILHADNDQHSSPYGLIITQVGAPTSTDTQSAYQIALFDSLPTRSNGSQPR